MSQTIHDIKVLKGLEGVRKRPEMYIGSVSKSQAGYFQLLKEIVDNCVDEYSSGRVKRIRISVTNLEKEGKQSFVVCDDGGGIPVEVHPDTKKTGLETVYLFLHAGGKFSTKEATRGTHGVGSSVVCALSEVFEVWTFRKKWHYLAIAKGKKKDGVRVSSRLPKEAKNWKNGTVVKYTPDYSIFANKSIKKPWLTSYLSQMVYFCPGLVVEMYWDGKKTVFRSSKGIKEYLMDIAKELEVEKVGKVFELTSKTLQVGMMWTTYTKEEQRYFVNRASTPNGTHSDLLLKTLTAVLSKFKNGKGKASYSPEDLRIGLISVMNVSVKNPQFSSQTKEELSTSVTFGDELKKALEEFFNKNKTFARQLIKQAVEISGARSELRKKISLVKKASKSKTGVLPGKLLEASPGIEPRKKELFLLEGDSAGGSAKNARFRHQEVLKLRGKFPNALRTLPSKLFENETISHILLSIGTGVGKDCDPEAMRVGKVLILTDPDKDGYHISSLLLTLFAEYMKPMVDAGKVYIVDAPLYTVTFRDKKYYANTLKELKKKLPKGADVSRMEVIRMKGWAEASAEDLKDLAFDKEKRVLYKVKKIEPNHKKMLVKIMGEDSAFRKLLLNI